jgi:sigma-E factor negative regulatory protein RseA
MSREQREHLSSLLDDELDLVAQDSALREASRNEELRGLWGRYHVIGEVLRGEPISRGTFAVADEVRKRLAEEPVALLPRSTALSRGLVQVGGWALAASVVLLAIVSGPTLFRGDAAPPLRIARQEPPVSVLYLDRAGSRWGVRRPEVESKLNSFLVNHQEYSPMAGLKGMVPYATLARYDSWR